MKSINQIFKYNTHLLDESEVQELVEYCRELEDEVFEKRQEKVFDKEHHLANLIREIYSSINTTLSTDEEAIRFKEIPRVDFEESVKNLKKYLEKFSEDFNFRL